MPLSAGSAEKLTLYIDGAECRVEAGASIAAAMAQSGRHGFSCDTSAKARGLFCGMGVCHDCLVTVDGRTSQRACMTPVSPGMHVERQPARPDILDERLKEIAPLPMAVGERRMDVLIVGAGPGGLSAALAAAEAGASVVVLDERHSAGGQFYKQPNTPVAKEVLRTDTQASDGASLIDRARNAGVTLVAGVTVWGASRNDDGELSVGCYGPDGAFYAVPDMMVIATGAFERPAPIPGWTLPGVMTAGAAQTLLRSYATLPGKRIVVAGNGPLNIQVAMEVLKAGGQVAALVNRALSPFHNPAAALAVLRCDPALALKGMRELARLTKARIPLFWRSRVLAVEGDTQVERVAISTPTGPRYFEADTVLLGGDFTASNEVSRLVGCAHDVAADGSLVARCGKDGESSLPNVYIVGEASRFGGAYVAMSEGRLAGLAVARKLGLSERSDAKAANRLLRSRRFQGALWSLFADGAEKKSELEDSTIACRCENITVGRLREISGKGPPDIATLKRLTRAGMGRCQSRYCGRTLTELTGKPQSQTQGLLAPQMPLRPVPLAALSVEKAEWGGHKRALLPERPPLSNQEPLPRTEVGTLVIGAGIAGLSTAYFLAESGDDVVVVERGYPGGLASGGNAGSLHAQLLSFDHGARAEGGGGPAARTLSLQRDSIDLWLSLEKRFGVDFEMKITGGLMVAETEAHLRFLEEKTAMERASGIDCHVIGKQDLHRLEPALSSAMIGAAYCPQEGKINPLIATRHMADAAMKAGTSIFDRTEVLSIEAAGNRFLVKTSRGTISATRIVNAAGAFASRIGAMLGLNVPVFGAPLQMVVTEAAAPAISHLVAHADRHLTLKQAANGNFLIGGGWTAGLDPIHSHPRPLFSSLEGNLWVAQHVVPGLRKLHVIRSWAAMNINIDGAPILGEHPAMPGFFNAVTSNGYTLGPLVGQLTAAMVTGRDPGRDLSAFSISRFQ